MPVKRIQLGGVFVKNIPQGMLPKLTGPARYRGTKRIELYFSQFDQVGWHREQTLLVPIGRRAFFVL